MTKEITPSAVGTQGVALILGVSRPRVHQLAQRDDWPEPVGRSGRVKVWLVSDIETWLVAHPPKAGQGSRR